MILYCHLAYAGQSICWGDNAWGKSNPPTGVVFISLVADGDFACGLRQDFYAQCWGRSGWNNLSPPFIQFSAISIKDFSGCGISLNNKQVQCWGRYRKTQVSGIPFKIITTNAGIHATSSAIIQLANGMVQFSGIKFETIGNRCGVRTQDHLLECWNLYRPTKWMFTHPLNIPFLQLIDGNRFSCGIRKNDLRIQCWGSRNYLFGRNGAPPTGQFLYIDAGFTHACGIRIDGVVLCWGVYFNNMDAPPLSISFSSVAAGNKFSCATINDTATCNGHGTFVYEKLECICDIGWDKATRCAQCADDDIQGHWIKSTCNHCKNGYAHSLNCRPPKTCVEAIKHIPNTFNSCKQKSKNSPLNFN